MFLACAIFISGDLDDVHGGDVHLGDVRQDDVVVAAVEQDVHYNRDNHSSNNHHTNMGCTN